MAGDEYLCPVTCVPINECTVHTLKDIIFTGSLEHLLRQTSACFLTLSPSCYQLFIEKLRTRHPPLRKPHFKSLFIHLWKLENWKHFKVYLIKGLNKDVVWLQAASETVTGFPSVSRSKGKSRQAVYHRLCFRWDGYSQHQATVSRICQHSVLKGRWNYPTQFPCYSGGRWVKKKRCVYFSSSASCRSLELLKVFLSLESTNCHLACLHSKLDYSYLAVTYASKSKSTTKFMIFDTSIQKFRAITYSVFKHGEFNVF